MSPAALTSETAPITGLTTSAYRFPTPTPEADGTLRWTATTAVTATLEAGGHTGLGWSYTSPATASVIRDHLATEVNGRDALDIEGGWAAMHRACRNLGTRGLVMHAISAVDIAWWDLKAALLGTSVAGLAGATRANVPIYGSGGFTNLNDAELCHQIQYWTDIGCEAMKIKIGQSWGTCIPHDLHRVRRLRALAQTGVELMVDANGAYTVGQARRVAADLDELDVVWFEEPVSSEDTAGLAAVRAAARCDVAAGEYAAEVSDFARLLPVVDCLQADATRCGGYTGWLRAATIARTHNRQISAHCAPALHAQIAGSVPNLRHIEYFIDHTRLEPQFVTHVPDPTYGHVAPNSDRPGHGMTLRPEADQWRAG